MRLTTIVAVMSMTCWIAGNARGEFVETWSTPGDVAGWVGAGGASLTTNPGSGGNTGDPNDGYLRAERTNGFAWVSNNGATPQLHGDVFAQHGDELTITLDVLVESAGDSIGGILFRYGSNAAGGGTWRYNSLPPGGTQDSSDGWITYQVPINKNWTDTDAQDAGWSNQSGNTFVDHFSDLADNTSSDLSKLDPDSGGGDGSVLGYDNYGFLDASGGAQPVDFTWDATTLGDWNTGSNWTPGGGPPNAVNHTATLGGAISGNSTVVVDSPVTVNRIAFTNSVNTYAVAGLGGVNLAATTDPNNIVDPTLSVQGTHQFQTPVTLLANTTAGLDSGASLELINRLDLNGNTLTTTGAGTLVVNNSFNMGNGTIINNSGVVSGGGTVGGDLDNVGGTVAPGNSPAR